MTGPFFVDTNVLVYAIDVSNAAQQTRAAEWMGYLWPTQTGRLSFQVLQEFYSVVTGKLRPAMSREAARQHVELF